jgi:nucleolar GTP-binding protein
MIAKIQGAKRKRDEVDDSDVDMDDLEDGEDGTEGWMDVDEGDDNAPKKKVKMNSGGVINKREPKSNRQLAGLRDEGVKSFPCLSRSAGTLTREICSF